MEILDLYDDNLNKLDETIIRGTKPDKGKNIMLAVAFIKNSEGKYLVQKTSKAKGNVYASNGGHVVHNETGIKTIIRELEEELSIKVKKQELEKITTFKYQGKPCIFEVYLLNKDDINIENLTLQKEEVEKVVWLSKEEIEKLINENKFRESHSFIFENYIK